MHRVKDWRKRAVVEGLAEANLAASVTDVIQPSHGQTRINRLRVHDGCNTVSIRRDMIRQSCSRPHRPNIKTAGMVSRVRLQTLFLVIFRRHCGGDRLTTPSGTTHRRSASSSARRAGAA